MSYKYKTLSGNFETHAFNPVTASLQSEVIFVDTLTNTQPITVTLQDPWDTTGRVIVIKDVGGGLATYPMTVTCATATNAIDGLTSQIASTAYASITVMSDGTNYWII